MTLFGIVDAPQITAIQQATLRRAATVLPVVELDHVEAREALRWLFRQALIGGTVAPNVHGTVTLSLRNVVWEKALQEATHQIGASYRFERGWVQVIGKDEGLIPEAVHFIPYYPFDDSRNFELNRAYRSITSGVTFGQGRDVRRVLSPSFRIRSARGTMTGETAVRRLIETQRAYPSFDSTGLRYGSGDPPTADVEVSYARARDPRLHYHDFWKREPNGSWTLFLRDGVVRNSAVDFRDTPLSKVLESAGKIYGVAFVMDPSIERNVDADLTGMPLDVFLDLLDYRNDLDYRSQNGIYRIVDSNNPSGLPRDPTNLPIPFTKFEGTDIHVALSWFFQKFGVRYRIDPKVRGTINVSLRNVTFETVLQNMTRQADATYRIENGVYEVIVRTDAENVSTPLTDHREIDQVNESFRASAKPERFLPGFSFAPEVGPITKSPTAQKGFLRLFRSHPKFQILTAFQLAPEKGVPTRAGLLVRYEIGPHGLSWDYWDVWVRRPGTPWRLASSAVSYPAE